MAIDCSLKFDNTKIDVLYNFFNALHVFFLSIMAVYLLISNNPYADFLHFYIMSMAIYSFT